VRRLIDDLSTRFRAEVPPRGQHSSHRNSIDCTTRTGATRSSGRAAIGAFHAAWESLGNHAVIPAGTGRPGRSSFDYVQVPWYAFLAGVSQAENSEPGYGQGAAGYGKRFGAAAADGTIENYWTSAILPSVLHQDPRFYQLGKGGFWHRTFYSMSRIVVTRSDSGSSQFNVSEVFGSAIAAGISTYSYHPHADKTLSNTASVWGSQIAYDTATIVLKEFWPDIRRKLTHKRSEPVTP
jgi:hypothetical protein